MLVTLSEIKTFLEIPESNTSKDAKLEMLGVHVSDIIEKLCNRKFAVRKYRDVYNTEDSTQVFLRHFPIVEVESIKYLETDLLLSDFSIDKDSGTMELIGFSVSLQTVRPRSMTTFNKNVAALEIVYRAGFEILPETVKFIVLNGVANLNNSSKYSGISSLAIGDFKISLRDAVPELDAKLLEQFIVNESLIDFGTSTDITDEVIPS